MRRDRAALRRFGGVARVKETYRETHSLPVFEVLWQDLRYGFRMLRRSPGFSILAILCLTLGIGSNAAVFTWIEGILLRPFPLVAHQDRMMAIAGWNRDVPGDPDVSWPDFQDFEKNCTLFDAFIVDRITGVTLAIGDKAEVARASVVSANYFDALGVRPILGRGFEPSENIGRNAHPVTVISYQLWQSRFKSDPSIIGKTQMLNGMPHTIIGVAPEGFYGTFVGWAMQFWVPLSMQEKFDPGGYKLEDRGARWIEGFVRLKPGVTLQQAQAEISAVAQAAGNRLSRDEPRPRGQFVPAVAHPFQQCSHSVPNARNRPRRGGLCAPHRMRERRQSAAGPRFRATARNDHPAGGRRGAQPAIEAASHRRHDPRDHRRGRRIPAGVLVPQLVRAVAAGARRLSG